MLVDSILKSLNPPVSEVEENWVKVAKQRLKEVKSGRVNPVAGTAVSEKIWGKPPISCHAFVQRAWILERRG